MSRQNRKVGFYEIALKNITGDFDQDPKILIDALKYGNTLSLKDRIIDNDKIFKAYNLENVTVDGNLLMLVMNTGKYNHIPPLINMKNGLKRGNPKEIEEAEQELTHIGLKFFDEFVSCIFEERRVGIHIKAFVGYLEILLTKYCNSKNIKYDYKFEFSIITKKDFKKELKELKKISEVNVTTDKKIIGDEFLNFSDRTEEISDAVKLVVKAKRAFSIQNFAENMWDKMNKNKDNLIYKLEVSGLNENGTRLWIKSDLMRRIEYVEVQVDVATGIVKSDSIFFHYKNILTNLYK